MYGHVISALLCPDEPSPSSNTGMAGTTNAEANKWAASSYGANFLVFGNPPAKSTEGSTRIADVRDGTSNTIFLAERYATCGAGGSEDTTYANLWADSNLKWRPTFCMNGAIPPDQPYMPCSKFQVAPGWNTDCDYSRAQSPHSGGIHASFGDGSVQFVKGEISDSTWASLCDPRDGNALGKDW
jgi:prepilin-type processing-associated H-X9-DG protein